VSLEIDMNSGTSSISTSINTDPARIEFERYVNLVVDNTHMRTNANPIDWWNARAEEFPMLYQLVMEFLHVPMSSATSESAMGRTVAESRNRLKPDTAAMLIFLKDNIDNW